VCVRHVGWPVLGVHSARTLVTSTPQEGGIDMKNGGADMQERRAESTWEDQLFEVILS
jgi:hypothetical protein